MHLFSGNFIGVSRVLLKCDGSEGYYHLGLLTPWIASAVTNSSFDISFTCTQRKDPFTRFPYVQVFYHQHVAGGGYNY